MKDKITGAFIIVFFISAILVPIMVIVSYSNRNKKENDSGIFVEIESHSSYDIVYDKDTRVMYAKSHSGTSTFCPLYNTDGTLKTYKENNNE